MSRLSIVFILSATLLTTVTFSHAAENVKDAEQLFFKGIEKYQLSEYDNAVELLKKTIPLLTDKEKKIKAFKYLAFSYMAYPKILDAQKAFKGILKLDPCYDMDRGEVSPKIIEIFELTKKEFECGKSGSISISCYDKDSNKNILDADVYLDGNPLGETPIKADNIKTGEHELKIIKKGFQTYSQIITVAENNNNIYKIALELPVLKKHKLYNKAKKLFDFKMYGEAIELLSEAIQEDLTFIDAYILRAKAYSEIKGKHLMSIKNLQKILQFDSQNITVMNLLANVYIYKMSKYGQAELHLNKVIEIDDDNSTAHRLLGVVYSRKSEHKKAIEEFRKSLKNDPNNVKTYIALGNAYKNVGRLPDAVMEFETAVNIEPDNADFHISLASIYETADLQEAAIREWEKVIGITKNKEKIEMANEHLSNLK